MSKKDNAMVNPMGEPFMVNYISREDLIHPVVGFSPFEASMVTDDQMKLIAKKLASHSSNQIVKSVIKVVAESVIGKEKNLK